ncbi:hypothetical protein GGX14DRAFT_546874 [Mycena pura]|uniref:Uncharacterized protein n=1 Tax=Mycena pura TaxID=153505 RepID=A0AAD6UQ82_9AGAR|nr:hypothetical protein GGX14DRAFT_546874 [Mycena pura]
MKRTKSKSRVGEGKRAIFPAKSKSKEPEPERRRQPADDRNSQALEGLSCGRLGRWFCGRKLTVQATNRTAPGITLLRLGRLTTHTSFPSTEQRLPSLVRNSMPYARHHAGIQLSYNLYSVQASSEARCLQAPVQVRFHYARTDTYMTLLTLWFGAQADQNIRFMDRTQTVGRRLSKFIAQRIAEGAETEELRGLDIALCRLRLLADAFIKMLDTQLVDALRRLAMQVLLSALRGGFARLGHYRQLRVLQPAVAGAPRCAHCAGSMSPTSRTLWWNGVAACMVCACAVAVEEFDRISDRVEFSKEMAENLLKASMASLGSRIILKEHRQFAQIAVDAVLTVCGSADCLRISGDAMTRSVDAK